MQDGDHVKHFRGDFFSLPSHFPAARFRRRPLNVDVWTFVCDVPSELTGHRSAGPLPVEDGPNPHPNPNPRSRSVKLCTPTTLRTPTSSASTPTTSSTSSKRVSRRPPASRRYLWAEFRAELWCVCSDASGWWTGRLRGKQGLFPNNYVTKI